MMDNVTHKSYSAKNMQFSTMQKLETIDVRKCNHNYFSKVIIKAGELLGQKGLVVIQSFEPVSLIKFLSDKGWRYSVDKINKNEYHTYFFHNSSTSIEYKKTIRKADEKKIMGI